MLRGATVDAQRIFEEERQRIAIMIISISSRHHYHRHNSPFFSPNILPPIKGTRLQYGPGSMAEQIIVSHQPGDDSKPLVTKADGIQYPKNPENGYVSKWPAAFRRCLGCGQEDHMFNT